MNGYLLDLVTEWFRVAANTDSAPLGRGDCIYVRIQNPLSNADGTANPVTVVIGRGTNVIWQLLPGQESPDIYCEDLQNVSVRIFALGGGVAPAFLNVVLYRRTKKEKPKGIQ